jgi:hypothetical protein
MDDANGKANAGETPALPGGNANGDLGQKALDQINHFAKLRHAPTP